jgi:hypothetical protein
VKVHDASSERKTAERLLPLLEEVIQIVREDWGAIVVAVVTDASGECRKARRILGRKYQDIMVLDCYGHQVCIVCIILWLSNNLSDQSRRWRLL